MNENKSTVIPSGHVVMIKYGKFSFRFRNPKPIVFSVEIRKATKSDKD
jgi:hypothetical protein